MKKSCSGVLERRQGLFHFLPAARASRMRENPFLSLMAPVPGAVLSTYYKDYLTQSSQHHPLMQSIESIEDCSHFPHEKTEALRC